MRLTLIALLAALTACSAAPRASLLDPSSLTPLDPQDLARSQEYGPPAPERLRTEKDLPEERRKSKPRTRAWGHVRVEIEGGAFLDDRVDDFFDSTWGMGVSGGFFLNEHISVGAMFDFMGAEEDDDYRFNGQKVGDVDTYLTVFTFSPMIWFHLTPASAVKNDGTPSLAVGAGPSLVAAYVNEDVDTILGDFDDDDDDGGWGFQAEVVGEVPLGHSITLAGGARYAVKKMGDFDDLDVVVGFLGIGIRF